MYLYTIIYFENKISMNMNKFMISQSINYILAHLFQILTFTYVRIFKTYYNEHYF
jgi:hypothetical protein